MYLFWDVPWLQGRGEACGRITWFSLVYCTLGEPPLEKNQRIQSRRGHFFFFFLRRPVIWEEDVWEYKVTPNLSQGVAWRTVTQLRISKKKLGCVEMLSPSSVQFSSVAQSCPTLCDPMDCSTPGLPVHHQLPEFTQTHVH